MPSFPVSVKSPDGREYVFFLSFGLFMLLSVPHQPCTIYISYAYGTIWPICAVPLNTNKPNQTDAFFPSFSNPVLVGY